MENALIRFSLLPLAVLASGCSPPEPIYPTRIFLSGTHTYPNIPNALFDGERVIAVPQNFQTEKQLAEWAKGIGAGFAGLKIGGDEIRFVTLAKKGRDRRTLVVAYYVGTEIVRESYVDANGIELEDKSNSIGRVIATGKWIEIWSQGEVVGKISLADVRRGFNMASPPQRWEGCE